MVKKKCLGCKKKLVVDRKNFYYRSGDKTKFQSYCIDCYLQTKRERTNSSALRKSRYGLTIQQYDELLAKQQNHCAICFVLFSFENKMSKPHVDHNHKTGKVRGLLCGRCNLAIGLFNDSLVTVNQAKTYLLENDD